MESANKRSTLSSIMGLRCPHCREAYLFKQPKTYGLRDLGTLHDHCPVCKTNLKPEPGFYFGAAYVNWGLTVLLWVSVVIVLKALDAASAIEYGFLTHPVTLLMTGIIATLVFFPYMFRLSRSIWAHIFIKRRK